MRRADSNAGLVMLLRLLLALLATAQMACAAELSQAIPRSSRQLVVVSTESWTTPSARLQRFVRPDAAAPWQPIGRPVAVLTGENGLAWGLGLHAVPAGAPRVKREGDRCAPAGVFRITGVFGRAGEESVGRLRMPYRRVGEGWEAVDDPASRYYNRMIDRRKIARPDWRSAERLLDYRLAIDIAHNPRGAPGAGSCIFIHEWTGRRRGTAGCTVLREEDLLTLVRWLDASAAPVLMQAPRVLSGGL